MKINLNKKDRELLDKLLLDKQMNIASADILFETCILSKDYQFDKNDYAKSVSDYFKLNLDNDEDLYFYESRIKPSIKRIDNDIYDKDYFRNNIKPVPFKGKGYELTYLTIKPYQCLPYDDISIKDNYVEVSNIGYFKKPFKYLVVNKNNVTWMSTDPNEINTMRESIDESKGHVLAFGLGLGYFPLMSANKKEVLSVTIIEKDQMIIDIFKKHILPLFENKEKINIIHDDAFNYAKKDLSKYDYLFIDIWHNPEDGLPMYLKFKKLLKNNNIQISYWLEKSIIAMYRRCLLTVIEESLLGYSDKDYQKKENEYDEIINDLYLKTKNKTFSSFDDIIQILKDNSLKNLI